MAVSASIEAYRQHESLAFEVPIELEGYFTLAVGEPDQTSIRQEDIPSKLTAHQLIEGSSTDSSTQQLRCVSKRPVRRRL